ncbi:extracellular solute-binding protein [Cellulosimicrobium cellulans]|uniref:ABC transporter substrate-binding protein n=1 Tax=Cellulosimicrobium cellulans TaxID=1710 RepID=UPI00188400DB|nr:extracellular solute-binding protein [Cellulosimicrobium cellulans]MBE9924876.1 extracellular solute-binding protein [Cellulosimicrobium cellulans]
MTRTSRRSPRPLPRTLAATSALALTAGLAACSTGEPASGDDGASGDLSGRTLKVAVYAGSWGESFTKAFVDPFEADTGATVELVPGGPADWLTALRSTQGGTPAYDVVAFTPNVVPSAVSAGVVAELDTERVEQFDQLNSVLAEQSNVDGTQYGVPLTVGSTGIAYRTDKVAEPPTDWSDLLDPAYCGHVAVSPLTFNTGVEFLAGLVNEAGGTITDPDDVDAAFDQLQALADCASAFPSDGTSVETALANGDAWIAAHWDGRAFVQQNAGEPIGFAYPASGSVGALTSLFVTEGTEQEDLAYAFLDYVASSEHQPVFSEGTWYAASNDENVYPEQFDEQIASGPGAYDDFVWVDYETITPQLPDLQARWQQIFG